MHNPKIFRTAIVGCGRISNIHIAALRALPDVEIVAVCDLDESLARQQALRYDIKNVFTDVERMLSEMRPDVVHLLTPPRTHLALTEVSAKYHAHMYVEKPMASNERDASAMLQLAKEADVQLCPGHSRLYETPFLEVRRRVLAGEIGRVVSVRAEQGFTPEGIARAAVIPWSYTYDWGIFENLIPHPLYVANSFLEDPGPPQVVAFNTGSVREAGVEEIRVLIPSKTAVGEVTLSLTAGPEHNVLEVRGTRGRITADFVSLTVVCTRKSELPGIVTRFTNNFSAAYQLTRSSFKTAIGIVTGRVKRYMGIRTLVGEFYRSLGEGLTSPVTPEDGLLTVRQMDYIKSACESVLKDRSYEAVNSRKDVSPKILVTGATGFVGGRVVERVSAEGVPVRATTRLVSRVRNQANVEWVQCNLARENELRRSLAGVETVFHCAAMAGPPGTLEEHNETNIKGTVRLATLAAEAGVKNLVYLSSISVYGMPNGGGPYLDELAPYDRRAADRGAYTQSKLDAEKALIDFARQHESPRVTILRPGTIYGPGAKLPVGRLQLPSPSQPVVAGSRRVPMPLTHIDNVIDAMLAAAQASVPTGRIYNVVDAPDLNQGQVARTLREVSGGRIRPFFVPYPLMWMMMLGVDLLGLARHRKLGTARFRLKRTLANMRFRCSEARRELGWEPRVTLSEGLSQVLSASD